MSDERELPPEWREVWGGLEAPPVLDADDDPADPRTRATVEWMRAAWSSLEVPLPVPAHEGVLARRPSRVLRLVAPLAATAVAAAVLALFLLAREAPERQPATEPAIEHVRAPAPLEAPRRDLTPNTLATPIRPNVREDGSVEMRSGKVLLILVENR